MDGFTPVEYKVVDLGIIEIDPKSPNGFEEFLNDLGKDGWELVVWHGLTRDTLVFKRS